MPDPRTPPLHVSPLQHEQVQRLVRRGTIMVAAAAGATMTKSRQDRHVDPDTVRLWRERWRAAASRLQAIEATDQPKRLSRAIDILVTDEQRPGAPAIFTWEPFMQIMAFACEKPEVADRPVSSRTPRDVADEAVTRGIGEQLSPRTVERLCKGERVAAPSQARVAHSPSRRSRRTDHADLHGV